MGSFDNNRARPTNSCNTLFIAHPEALVLTGEGPGSPQLGQWIAAF